MYYLSDNAHLKKLVSFVLYLRKQENQWRLGLLFKKKKIGAVIRNSFVQ